ncbi:MAG: hypothetical protein HOK06_07260 [Rhodospirillaceae bacterium]|jgi:hemerythrin|nr:hypothetical protein [Rhodospirillaceae bacterium]MBT4219514.1 hypothetical protein [Rhodospirillaceae bacterium]MBT4463493.1 hypothetical protein [Rhodospirillaceae bacterium]MBT5013779.1 hypothetical protein [Rhodospirillaceae bacterium]MBT5308817.1 hypothetical protein [Rhodospirillaceae bacterium]
MMKIRWLESFETGIKEIDKDHRQLVDTVTDIQAAFKDGDMDRYRELCDTFYDLAEKHFKREEAILMSIDFPRVEAHEASHSHLLDLVSKALKIAKEETDKNVIESSLEDLIFYLFEDVIKADAEFKSYYQEHAQG